MCLLATGTWLGRTQNRPWPTCHSSWGLVPQLHSWLHPKHRSSPLGTPRASVVPGHSEALALAARIKISLSCSSFLCFSIWSSCSKNLSWARTSLACSYLSSSYKEGKNGLLINSKPSWTVCSPTWSSAHSAALQALHLMCPHVYTRKGAASSRTASTLYTLLCGFF